jgi:2-keto-3-deoxy-L-rhamnonate aldolase RhmA
MQSVENASDIISTEGVGCLFFGPDDMKVQMGIPVNTPVLENKRLLDAMARTAQAAREAGKFAGTVASDKDTLRVALEMGYRMIVGGSDIVFLRTLAAQRLKELRGVCEEPRPSGPAGTGGQG